jgi:hypothetical protein
MKLNEDVVRTLELLATIGLIVVSIYFDFSAPGGPAWNTLGLLVGGVCLGWIVKTLSVTADEATKLTGKVERIIWARHPRAEIWRGYYHQFLQRLWAPVNTDESIMLVAIKHHPSGVIFAINRPGRHHDLVRLMDELGYGIKDNDHRAYEDQGFITSRGRYVNRYEAAAIAKRCRQILPRGMTGSDDELYSEDLFEGGLDV